MTESVNEGYMAVKVALNPTPRQERLLRSHAGAARFAYNKAIEHAREVIRAGGGCPVSYYAPRRWWNASKAELAPWWRECSKEAFNSGLEAAATALSNWLASCHHWRKGPKVGFPRFKDAESRPYFAYTTGTFGPIAGDPKGLALPRIGRVHCFENVAQRVGDRRVIRMAVTRSDEHWTTSLLVVTRKTDTPPRDARIVGVDLGLKTLATLSDGTVVPNPRNHNRDAARQRRADEAVARAMPGSKRQARAIRHVGRIRRHTANRRRDGLEKLVSALVRRYDVIAIETLNVKGMAANPALRTQVLDAGFATFARLLEARAPLHGAVVHRVDRWYPSSKCCSACGHVRRHLELDERTYICPECGLSIDRDLNAAINLRLVAVGATETKNAREGANQAAAKAA